MTIEQYDKLTQKQKDAMKHLQERSGIEWSDFLEDAVAPTLLFPYVAIPNFHGMYVGIEKDGYTHS